MQRTGFDGKVVFEVTGATVREVVVGQGFMRAVPEYETFMGAASNLFLNIIQIMSRTKAVIIDTEETDPVIIELSDFWKFANGTTDYRAIWERFLDLSTIDINNEWINSAIKGASDPQLLAPAVIQPDAPADDNLSEEEKKSEMSTS